MTPHEWAEVFEAGERASAGGLNPISNSFSAMARQLKEIADRGRVKEDQFMGKPVSELTYEEAILFRRYLEDSHRLVPVATLEAMNQIIARGPKSQPISILPPTIIEHGQREGRP